MCECACVCMSLFVWPACYRLDKLKQLGLFLLVSRSESWACLYYIGYKVVVVGSVVVRKFISHFMDV